MDNNYRWQFQKWFWVVYQRWNDSFLWYIGRLYLCNILPPPIILLQDETSAITWLVHLVSELLPYQCRFELFNKTSHIQAKIFVKKTSIHYQAAKRLFINWIKIILSTFSRLNMNTTTQDKSTKTSPIRLLTWWFASECSGPDVFILSIRLWWHVGLFWWCGWNKLHANVQLFWRKWKKLHPLSSSELLLWGRILSMQWRWVHPCLQILWLPDWLPGCFRWTCLCVRAMLCQFLSLWWRNLYPTISGL